MTLTQKIIQNLSRNKNVQGFLADFGKVSRDLKDKSKQLNQLWSSERHKTVKQAYAQYQKMVKSISKAQMELDREVNKAISLIVRSADDVEKNLSAYKKKAIAQKAKVEESLFKKSSTHKGPRPSRKSASPAQKSPRKRAPKKPVGRASAKRA